MVEIAVALPALLLLLLGTVEVGNAVNSYLTVNEVSRDGARLVARHGAAADLPGLISAEASRLRGAAPRSTITYGTDATGNQTVSVEIDYDYQFIFATIPFMTRILPRPFTLRAITTMAIP